MTNHRGILHDEHVYDEPSVFNPERFIINGKVECNTSDPSKIAFGYGRRQVKVIILWCSLTDTSNRICPGVHFAENMLWITIACLLSAYHLDQPTDENGDPVPVELNASSGMIAYVHIFIMFQFLRSHPSQNIKILSVPHRFSTFAYVFATHRRKNLKHCSLIE